MGPILRIATLSALLQFLLIAGERREFAGTPRLVPPLAAEALPRASCGAAQDLTIQALERMQADSGQSQLEDANELLKRAADLCDELADAWYYRSLVEAKLGHRGKADYALGRARDFRSDALNDGLNPFILATPQTKPLSEVAQRWALVVGISTFADKNVPTLPYTAADATAFKDVLTDPKVGGFKPENVRLLTDQTATLSGIKKALNWLARSAAPNDLVVVYVASHGSPRSADTVGANYIITHDTEVGPDIDPDSLYASAFPMVELSNAVATRLKSLRTAVFLDTCYSGGAVTPGVKRSVPALPNASISKATLEHISQGTGRVIFAASQVDQESHESPELKHGYFTYFLVQALKQHPGMPLSGIFEQVQKEVSARVEKDYELYGSHQTPVMNQSSDNADFALGVTGTQTADLTAGVLR